MNAHHREAQHLGEIVARSTRLTCHERDRKQVLAALREHDELQALRRDADLLRRCGDAIDGLKAAGISVPADLEKDAIDRFLPEARERLQAHLHREIVARLERELGPLLRRRTLELAQRLEDAAQEIERAAAAAAEKFGLPSGENSVGHELRHGAGFFRDRAARPLAWADQANVRACIGASFAEPL